MQFDLARTVVSARHHRHAHRPDHAGWAPPPRPHRPAAIDLEYRFGVLYGNKGPVTNRNHACDAHAPHTSVVTYCTHALLCTHIAQTRAHHHHQQAARQSQLFPGPSCFCSSFFSPSPHFLFLFRAYK